PMVRGGLLRCRSGDRDEDAAGLEHLPRALLGLAADRIEDHIHVPDHGLERRRRVIDDGPCAQGPDERDVAGGRGADYLSARPPPELHRVEADPTRRTVDEEALPGLETAHIEKP